MQLRGQNAAHLQSVGASEWVCRTDCCYPRRELGSFISDYIQDQVINISMLPRKMYYLTSANASTVPLNLEYISLCHVLFFIFIYSYLTSMCNRMVMTDLDMILVSCAWLLRNLHPNKLHSSPCPFHNLRMVWPTLRTRLSYEECRNQHKAKGKYRS